MSTTMGEMPMPGGWTMSMMWMRMPGQSWLGAAAMFLGMWSAMMVVMTLPSLVPSLRGYHRALERSAANAPGSLVALVSAGYCCIWVIVGVATFAAGVTLAALAMRVVAVARLVPMAAAGVVLVAGVVQRSAWKARYLACCREVHRGRVTCPASAPEAWRHGLRFGLHCACSCTGPMAIVLVLGMMDPVVMGVVTVAVTLERLAPEGERVARASGAVAMGVGLLLLVRAAA